MVIQHPENIYGARKTLEEESETIANNSQSQTPSKDGLPHLSPFREEDTRIFHKLID